MKHRSLREGHQSERERERERERPTGLSEREIGLREELFDTFGFDFEQN